MDFTKNNIMEWISVKEKMPKGFADVLLCAQDGSMFVGKKSIFADFFMLQGGELLPEDNPIHFWMPLPKPPMV